MLCVTVVKPEGSKFRHTCTNCGWFMLRRNTMPPNRTCGTPYLTEVVEKKVSKKRVSMGRGAGTELHNLLKKFRIGFRPGCKCKQHIVEMNVRGVVWCRQNVEKILGWLKEEAVERDMYFNKTVVRMLIKRAIAKAEQQKAVEAFV